MKLSDFDYTLPKELIAQHPLKEREQARLLVVKRGETKFEHRIFKDITTYLKKGDLLVLNDTKVLPSRLLGRRSSGGKAEILLVNKKDGLTFDALIKPARIKVGEEIKFNHRGLTGLITARGQITFEVDNPDTVYASGVMPLPPYIKREPGESDAEDYQTVYAKNKGAIASPTAGLHFTHKLLDEIKTRGTKAAYITLHVGYSTFRPVKAEDITQHKMGKEYFTINDQTAALIDKTRSEGVRIFAVGTTSCRALEAYADGQRQGDTDLFIYPGYKFKIVDCLLTNFHLPKTTLFMLASAFGGEALIKKAYQEAIKEEYRFYSYGDAMLIL